MDPEIRKAGLDTIKNKEESKILKKKVPKFHRSKVRKSSVLPFVWTNDIENNYRFQLAGYLNEKEYLARSNFKSVEKWPDCGLIKKIVKLDGSCGYFGKLRECPPLTKDNFHDCCSRDIIWKHTLYYNSSFLNKSKKYPDINMPREKTSGLSSSDYVPILGTNSLAIPKKKKKAKKKNISENLSPETEDVNLNSGIIEKKTKPKVKAFKEQAGKIIKGNEINMGEKPKIEKVKSKLKQNLSINEMNSSLGEKSETRVKQIENGPILLPSGFFAKKKEILVPKAPSTIAKKKKSTKSEDAAVPATKSAKKDSLIKGKKLKSKLISSEGKPIDLSKITGKKAKRNANTKPPVHEIALQSEAIKSGFLNRVNYDAPKELIHKPLIKDEISKTQTSKTKERKTKKSAKVKNDTFTEGHIRRIMSYANPLTRCPLVVQTDPQKKLSKIKEWLSKPVLS